MPARTLARTHTRAPPPTRQLARWQGGHYGTAAAAVTFADLFQLKRSSLVEILGASGGKAKLFRQTGKLIRQAQAKLRVRQVLVLIGKYDE